jgi:hypothetical protein
MRCQSGRLVRQLAGRRLRWPCDPRDAPLPIFWRCRLLLAAGIFLSLLLSVRSIFHIFTPWISQIALSGNLPAVDSFDNTARWFLAARQDVASSDAEHESYLKGIRHGQENHSDQASRN